MSVSTPAAIASEQLYGLGLGRGDVERHVVETLRLWIVTYLADYERQNGLVPRTLLVPPTPESIHGGIDFATWGAELLPELIAVVQPVGEVERYGDSGNYAAWFSVMVAAIVHFEGDQEQARGQADAYGTVLQKLIPQQGAFGENPDGSPFAVRTRIESPYALSFVDDTVRDVVCATVSARTFLESLVSDFDGPRVPPADPYAIPGAPITVNEVEVALIRGTPDDSGFLPADAVILDGTVVPSVILHEVVTVDEPAD